MVELWEHQIKGAEFIRSNQSCALYWEMRCGKTFTTIEGTKGGTRLIICPNGVKRVWVDDLQAMGEKDVWVWSRSKKDRPATRPTTVIINYESLWRCDILEYGWDSVIFDESLRLQNWGAKLVKYLLANRYLYNKGKVILLSGSPCPEGYHQLITQMLIAHGTWDGELDRVYDVLNKGWTYDDYSYKWQINRGYSAVCKDVMHAFASSMTQIEAGITTQLLHRVVRVEPTDHELMLAETADGLEGAHVGIRLHSASVGRDIDGKIESSVKLDAVAEYVGDLGVPCVVMCHHTEAIKYLVDKIGKESMAIYGDVTQPVREQIIAQFKTGALKCVVCQVKCVKTGVNLSAASTLIYAENSASGEDRIQSEQRCTVKGKEAVEVIDFVCLDIDTKIMDSVRGKKDFSYSSIQRKP